MSSPDLCLGYFIILKPYRYVSEGKVCPGLSICTEWKVPSYDLIYNDSDTLKSVRALERMLGSPNVDCQQTAEALLSSYAKGDVSALPSFTTLDAARHTREIFFVNQDAEIYTATASRTDIQRHSLEHLYAGLDDIVLDPGSRLIGYEVVDADCLCDTFKRPDLSSQLRGHEIAEGGMGLLENEADARRVITLMLAGKITSEPQLKWIPCAVRMYD